MKHHQLRALVAIADNGSVRAGARSISLSQTALTKAIGELETDLHVSLMHRSSKGAQLTPIGLELVERARFILSEIDGARAHVERHRGGVTSRVAAALSPGFVSRYLPQVFNSFRGKFPDAQVSLQDVYLSQTLPKLRDGSIDLALAAILPEGIGADLQFQPMGELEIVIVARRGSFKGSVSSIAALEDEHWLLDFSRCGMSELVRQAFLREGCQVPTKVTECLSVFSSFALNEDCGCITPAPKVALAAKAFSPRLEEIRLEKPLPRIPFGLLLRRDARLSPAVEWMCECFRAAIKTPA